MADRGPDIRAQVYSAEHRLRTIFEISGVACLAAFPILVNGQSASGPGEEIVVTSSRIASSAREIGTAVSVITADDIEARGYGAISDVLRSQPAIGVSNSGGMGKQTSVRVRGEESYRTLVMIDGVEFSDPTATQVGPIFDHLVATDDFERVEILRGSQGFIYGADAGGVVNMFTRTGDGDVGGRVRLEAGRFATRRLTANLSGGSDRGDFFVSAADVESDGFNSTTTDSELRDDDGYENTTLHTKLGLNLGDDLRIQVVARDISARTEFDNCGFPTIHDCVGDTRQTTMRLSADYAGERFTHSAAYGISNVNRENFTTGVSAFATDGEVDHVEYTGSFEPSDSVTLVYGLDFEAESVAAGSASMNRDQRAYYFEYQGRFGDQLFFTVGARQDDNDDFGEHTSARTSLAYLSDLPNGLSIKYRVSVGTGFRAPSLSEIAYNLGPFSFPPSAGLALKEETSRGYDLGLQLATASGRSFEANYFDQEIEDEIFFDLATFSGYLQSLGTGRSRGIELAARIPFAGRWEVAGNVTFNDTENTAGEQRIRRPKRFGNLGLSYRSGSERVRVFANYRLSRDSVDEIFGIGRVSLPDYEVLDIGASYSATEALTVYGRLENATDERYEEVIGFRTSGAAAYAGIRFSF